MSSKPNHPKIHQKTTIFRPKPSVQRTSHVKTIRLPDVKFNSFHFLNSLTITDFCNVPLIRFVQVVS